MDKAISAGTQLLHTPIPMRRKSHAIASKQYEIPWESNILPDASLRSSAVRFSI
jgi:hypothetical protein